MNEPNVPTQNAPTAPKLGLINWFSHNHVAANILMALFLIGGLVGVSSMRTETFPSIDPGLITVSVAYPGATPYEVADAITQRVEEALSGTEGVKRIASTASEGFGVINVELEDFVNPDDVYNDVETSVNGLLDFPPENAERPIITKVRATPGVMSLALHGDVSEVVVKHWAEVIEDELRQLDGVALTTLRGIRDYEISIEVSEDALRRYGMSMQDIANVISQFSRDIPAGTLESDQGDILLRVQEKRFTGEEFEQIVLRTLPDGSSLRLGDIAKVIDGFENTNLVSRFNGEPAAFIDIQRSESEDTLAVAESVFDYLEDLTLPPGLQLSLEQDETVVLKDRISLMLRNAILGFVLVFLILLVFLDLKLAFWTSAAIPICFLGGLMLIGAMGYSLNMVSLFALIVVLGIVVDDAIVTGESIFEAQERHRQDPNAVLRGVQAVVAPVTIGVATTMAAFAPLLFSTGTLGQIIAVVPAVVLSILFVSLMEAYFILPAHLSHAGRWSRGVVAEIREFVSQKLVSFTEQYLVPAARFAIAWRYAMVAGFLALMIITMGMLSSGIVRFIFFPQIEGDQITIGVTMPQGTPFDVTRGTLLQIENEIVAVRNELAEHYADPMVSVSISVGQTVGADTPGVEGGSSNGSHLGQAVVRLVSSDYREQSALEIERMIRQRVQDLPNIETLSFQSSLVGGEADIEIELAHPEESQLTKAAEELKSLMKQLPGAINVADSFELGKAEYVFELNAEGLAVGLTPADLGNQLRAAFFGLEVQRFQRGRSEMVVYLRYPEEERESIAGLLNMRVRLPNGAEAPLRSVANISEQRGFSQIRSVDGRRIVSVTGDIDPAVSTPGDAIAYLEAQVLPALQQRYSGLVSSFAGQSRDQAEDLASLMRNMLIALLLIYVMLGAQLRSYTQPVMIMAAIPFGVVGAIWGHFLLGYDLTFISLFGVVALMGVVVNDSVVLVDYLNKQHAAGTSFYDSTLLAIKRRFRPILLTTLTTSLGLLPMLLETSKQAQFLIPMVVSLATGIIFSTVVILFLVPCLVMIAEDGKRLLARVSVRALPQNTV